jgi:signal transduction histidine kinase
MTEGRAQRDRADMSDERARRRVRVTAIAFLITVGVTLFFGLTARTPPAHPESGGPGFAYVGVVLLFPIAGFLILWRQPRNAVGWILVVIGFAWLTPLAELGEWLLSRGLPGGAELSALAGGSWAPPVLLTGTLLLLRFPNGHLLSPRWRFVEWLALVDMVAIVAAIAVYPSTFEDLGYPAVHNPLVVPGVSHAAEVLLPAILFCFPVAIVLSAVSLVLRFRRSRGVERLQMKWIATAAAIVATLYFTGVVASLGQVSGSGGGGEPWWLALLDNLSFLSFVLLPTAIVVAVLRYRLYEIDVVINKAIVYGALAAFVTAAYVGIVVGLGHVIGSERSIPLQVAATVVVAVAFQPLRERLQRFANRLVYGRRATPYEVLARFAEQVAGTYSTDEIASALAKLLVEGTGATTAEVWVARDGTTRLEAIWPAAAEPSVTLPADDELTRVAPVVHRGDALGALVIRKGASEPIGPSDEKLLADVAAQAGLVLRNVRLVDDLRASRQRLVAARDAERRKLERNIHDGAQQRLVALAVLYNMAAGLAKPLGEQRQAAIADLGAQAQTALETLRDLARGIYPAVLSDSGLVPALEGQARKSSVPIEVLAESVGRHPQEIEAAVYFCCLEALQNVAKYAGASRAVVRLEERDGEIAFEVRDDGVGFDRDAIDEGLGMRNMEDRIAAIGGALEIRSEPGRGTTIAGYVPVPRGARTLEPIR